jgi:outer membrane protein assembly factor BamD
MASLRFIPALMLAGVAALAVGCENEQPRTALNYTANAKRAYDVAMEDFKHHNWLEAQSEFRDVKRKFSYSKYAKLAELRIADIDYEQEKYAEAVHEYRQFIHDHRSDNEDVAYARSRIAESQFMQIPDSFLLPAPEERDQGQLMDAYKELRGFLHDYPDAKESVHVRELLGTVTARLIKHELYVARFYLGKDNYIAAVARIQYALRNFSAAAESEEGGPVVQSGLEPEALLLLGETYLKMHKQTEARQSFCTIIARYPESALTTHAKGYVVFMNQSCT